MQHVALLQGGPQRAVQPVLEVEVAVPLHDVGEQVTEERAVVVEQRGELRVSLVVTSWSRRTWRGGSAAQSRESRPWSGYGLPSPTRLKITRSDSDRRPDQGALSSATRSGTVARMTAPAERPAERPPRVAGGEAAGRRCHPAPLAALTEHPVVDTVRPGYEFEGRRSSSAG